LERARGMRPEEIEQLVVDFGERGLLLEQIPHNDCTNHLFANAKRHNDGRTLEVGPQWQALLVEERLSRAEHFADLALLEAEFRYAGALQTLGGKGAELATLVVD